jgi:hypothetical protein
MHNIKRSWKLRLNILIALIGIGFEQMMLRLGLIACASKLNYSQACEQAQLNATTTTVGNAGLLYIFSGVQPVGPAGADGTLVAGPFTMGSPFAAGASAALPSVLSPTLPANVNASASVQPTWWRIKTSASVAVLDGSAGISAADMTIGLPTSGQPVALTGFTITSGNSGH